ncbi:MAG: peptidoglycan-binding protein [Flavobacteriales bacterium]|nr:peptidoglycan-binding protein [Flavobacteriales bacterium]
MKSLLINFTLLTLTFSGFCQEIPKDLPVDAEPGKCYAQCRIPAKFESRTERIMTKPEGKVLKKIPARYETQEFKVLEREAYTVKRVIPATYKTIKEKVLVDEGTSKIKVTPEQYETISEQILVTPSRTEWVKGSSEENCMGSNPSDCKVWCLKEVPAEYKTVYKRALKTPAKYEEIKTEPRYKTIYKEIVDQPARVIEETVPAKFRTEYRRVLVEEAKTIEEIVPAQYTTVTKKVMVQEEMVGTWTEILCKAELTPNRIEQIQRALLGEGYDIGPHGVDNVFGRNTIKALTKYQEDNDLPIGNLNIETLEYLGVNL